MFPFPSYTSFSLRIVVVDDDGRFLALLFSSAFFRVRLEVKHLEKSRQRALCCSGCGIGVAWEGDVFTLPGAEGVVGAYVNPLGYVHQVGLVCGGGGGCFLFLWHGMSIF